MKKCTTYTLGKTHVTKEYDTDPDTSYLGEYGSKYKPGCIVRADRSFYEDHIDDDEYEPREIRGEYSFFYPPDNGEKIGSDDYKEYSLQSYEYYEDLNNNQWAYVIIRVTTHISTDTGISDTVFNTLSGVEDHWDKDSREYIENDIVPDLILKNIAELKKMGFQEDEIKKSTDNPVFGKDW